MFPGGQVEEWERGSIEDAMRREAGEELGVVPVEFAYLNGGGDQIITEAGVLVTPFIVTSWIGDVSEVILDKGNPVEWVDLCDIDKMPMESVRMMGGMIREYLEMEER